MPTYEENKAYHIKRAHIPYAQENRKRLYNILENHSKYSAEDIAVTLYVMYQQHNYSYESIIGLVEYFWNHKFYEARKMFDDFRKQACDIGKGDDYIGKVISRKYGNLLSRIEC